MQNRMQIIPNDLKTLILEFLPFKEYPKMRLVCQDFCAILNTTPRLWARQMFSEYLDPRGEKLDMFEMDLYEERPPVSEEQIDFDKVKNAAEILKDHFTIKLKCKQFLDAFLEPKDCKQFLNYLLSSFSSPNYPAPTLKKDIHFFPTNSLFQNFLTEIYFGLLSKPCPTDGRQSIVSNIVKVIEKSSVERQLPAGRLVSLRWYLFDSLKPSEGDADLLTELYRIVYEMAKNYCEMVIACLKVTKRCEDLLSEYIRLWNGFVITTMEVNRIFLPFSIFLNKIWRSSCKGYPNFPEFSIWRMMIKVWLSEVYTPISPRVHQAFRVTLMNLRTQESCFDFFEPSMLGESDPAESQYYETLTEFYGAKSLEPDCETAKEEKFRLLKEAYQVMCDLSYDEFTIFYWECSPVKQDTPKGTLDSMILQDTLQLYECCKRFLFGVPKEISDFLKTDVGRMESLFGKELSSKAQEGQVLLVKDFLSQFFDSTIQNTKFEELYKCFEDNEEEILESKNAELNFGGITKMLDPKGALREQLCSDKKFRGALNKILGKKSIKFNFFLNYLENMNREIDSQYRERDEILKEIMEQGFVQVDEKFESFYTLNKNPSDIHILNLTSASASIPTSTFEEKQPGLESEQKVENLIV